MSARFLSTPSARRATCNTVRLLRMLFISIHALREEGDRCARLALWMADNFYPRPPRGGRHTASAMSQQRRRFLSTPSARRATSLKRFQKAPLRDFYPRPPRGGRPDQLVCRSRCPEISIHALREEGDTAAVRKNDRQTEFLSTPSARRATFCAASASGATADFYPRPPRGGRQYYYSGREQKRQFLSTPSARRATLSALGVQLLYSISIHALREEGDARPFLTAAQRSRFLSTPSARRATLCPVPALWAVHNFYPRPPRGGRRPTGRRFPWQR